MKQHATYRPDGEATSGDFDGTVVFDVGGRLFRVLRQTIQTRPSALLASLVDDLGTDSSRPMFIDANPDRFSYILDWYRYGEMFIPNDSTIEAVLRDARFFFVAGRDQNKWHVTCDPSNICLRGSRCHDDHGDFLLAKLRGSHSGHMFGHQGSL